VPLERLKAEVICADILSDPNNSLYPGQGNFDNLASIGGGKDPCQTETVLAVIHLLEGRIRTMTGIGSKSVSMLPSNVLRSFIFSPGAALSCST